MTDEIYCTNFGIGRNGHAECYVYRGNPKNGYVIKCFEHVDGWVVLDGLRGNQRGLKMGIRTAERAIEVADAILRHATAVDGDGCLTFDRVAVRRKTVWY